MKTKLLKSLRAQAYRDIKLIGKPCQGVVDYIILDRGDFLRYVEGHDRDDALKALEDARRDDILANVKELRRDWNIPRKKYFRIKA